MEEPSRRSGEPDESAEPTVPKPGWLGPLVAGLFFAFERSLAYPASYLLVPDREIWPIQVGSWIWILGQGAAIAGILHLLVRILGVDRGAGLPRDPGRIDRFSAAARALFLAAVTLIAFETRAFWPETIPSTPWVDTIFGIDAMAREGRWLAPHEVARSIPPEIDPASRARVHGLAVDWVRLVFSSVDDRMDGYVLLGAIPGGLLPLAVWLLARRLTRRRAVPEVAAFLAAVSFWPVVMARTGVGLEPYVLLTILALERTAAGLDESPGERRRLLSLAAAGILSGLACHFYLAGYLGVIAIGAVVTGRSIRLRQPRLAVVFLAGALLLLLPLAVAFLPRPELFGSRAQELLEKGYSWSGPLAFVGKLALHAGLLFFSGDPLSRHSRGAEPPFGPAEVALLVIGLVALLARPRSRTRPWLPAALLAVLLFFAGAAGTPWYLSPNSCRTEVVGVLAIVLIAEGLVAAARAPRWSRAFGFVVVPLVALGLGVASLARLVDWACPSPPSEPGFGQSATHAGRFVAIAGRERVVIDPRAFVEHQTPFTAAFQLDRDHPLERIDLPIVRRLEGDGAAGATCPLAPGGRCVWYVTFAPPGARHAVDLGTTPGVAGPLRAIDIRTAVEPESKSGSGG